MSASRQLAAIMFTDIVGYTALMGRDEEVALELLRKSRDLQKNLVAKHGGKWLKEMGDGVLTQFTSALEAVLCAREIQQRAASFSGKIRIGIHLGDVTVENDDIFGDGVNIASRLQSVADPGGIYVSSSVEKAIHGHPDLQTTDLGMLKLKNVDYGVHTHALIGHNLPKPKTYAKYRSDNRRILFIGFAAMLVVALSIWKFVLDEGGSKIQSIAVMPFESLSEQPANEEYFVRGMTQALTSNLAKVSALKVIMYETASIIQAQEASFLDIGRQLDVDAIVEGSVIREGNLVRITAQLVDARTQELLWVGTYDKDYSSILQLHSEVASDIVREIEVVVTPQEEKLLASAGIVNPEAYDAFLKGMYHLYELSPQHYDSALINFIESLRIDPNNAEAYAGIALFWAHSGQWGGEAPMIAGRKCHEAAERALEIDPDLALAHLALANYYTGYSWDWENGVKEFVKTIALDPNLSEPRIFYADMLMSLHRSPEALVQIDKAVELDPLNPFVYCVKGWVYFANNDFDKAIEAFNTSLESGPNIPLTHRCLWTIYHLKGEYDKAMDHAIKFYANQDFPETVEDLKSYNGSSTYQETLRYAAQRMAGRSTTQYIQGMRVARLYTFSGDNELALDWLERAYQEHYTSFFSLNVDPHWDSLHEEPRFRILLEKMNLTLEE